MTIYEKIGGAPAMSQAVDIFYRKVLMDDRISHFFDSTDMELQHAKQVAFLTMAFGGPHQYSGRDMREAHAHMNLTEEHYDAVMEHLTDTLRELEVSEEDVKQVEAVAATVKDDILNR